MRKILQLKNLLMVMALLFMPMLASAQSNDKTTGLAFEVGEVSGMQYAIIAGLGTHSATGALDIPGTVTDDNGSYPVFVIGVSAFEDCADLTSLTIPGSVQIIDNWAFFGCKGLTGDLIIPEGVFYVGVQAFANCFGFTSTPSLPSTLETIDDGAFAACQYMTGNLIIPDNVTYIGERAFWNCRLIEGVTIPNTVTEIGAEAFYYCFALSGDLTIPGSVKTIGDMAFLACYSLTSLTLSEGVTDIGFQAFSDCYGLTNITIPSSVKTIEAAFTFWESLTDVTVSWETPPSIDGLRVFLNTDIDGNPIDVSNITLHIPAGTLAAYQAAPVWQGFILVEDIPAGINSINKEDVIKKNAVYSINGQYLGTDLQALPKGLYIVNGKKVMK